MPEPTSVTIPVTDEHIKRFQSRAQLHSIFSYAILLLIFFLFALCWYIFFRAQEIGNPATSLSLFQQLQTAKFYQAAIVKAAEVELNSVIGEARLGQSSSVDVLQSQADLATRKMKLAVLETKERLMLDVGYFTDIDLIQSKEELEAQTAPLKEYLDAMVKSRDEAKDRFVVGEAGESDVAQAEGFVAEAELRSELNQERVAAAPTAIQLRNKTGTIDTLELVRVNLIRFGGVAVTLFLMSVLVPIYRYNVRLRAYYLACADALIICRDSRVDDFGKLLNLLTPSFTFDKEPRTPVDSVASALGGAIGLVRKV